MKGGAIDTPYLHVKAEKILQRSLEPSFKLSLAAKDASLVLEAGALAHVDLAVARAVHDKMGEAIELGHGDEDMAATYFASALA
jgi:3-hydroxyisobutyrate dehydrogenase